MTRGRSKAQVTAQDTIRSLLAFYWLEMAGAKNILGARPVSHVAEPAVAMAMGMLSCYVHDAQGMEISSLGS